MLRKLTILFTPLDAVGHVNACIGIAEVLRDKGHRIVFAVRAVWRGKLSKYGFEEHILDSNELNESELTEDPAKLWADVVIEADLFGSVAPIDKLVKYNSFRTMVEIAMTNHELFEQTIAIIKPDIIIIDHLIWLPSLMNCGIPWVWSISCNPLMMDKAIDDDRLPPACLGLEINGDRKQWNKYREERDKAGRNNWNEYNSWLIQKGFPTLPENKMLIPSPYLNIYMYPKELDYTDVRQLPSRWHQFDCFKRSGDLDCFEIPEKLRNRTGKLIYLSMGSMGGADIKLMKRLVSILSKSNHSFIVSKGPLSDQYELADNMWGERTVPQIKVLPIVDLVITHGGNNSFTETLFFGKPMIVMPLFADQYDNAQRIVDKELGLRMDPYLCGEKELIESIDRLLNDESLGFNLENISNRMKSSNSVNKITKLIETLVI